MSRTNKAETKANTILMENIPYSYLTKGPKLCREKEEGNREYKFKLTGLTDEQRNHRITQLHWRLNEGNDSAVYLIGVEDDGNQLGISDEELKESLRNLKYMADQVGCEMIVKQLFAGEQGLTAEIHMRRLTRLTVDTCQLNVATVGDLEAGKSTLIGVLCTGKLDNGKGLARTQVFRHNHEVETGRTSCISHHLVHFDDKGHVLNSEPSSGSAGKGMRLRALSDLELADEACRAVALVDLAGHSKYLKTTLHGLVGRKLDYCLGCIALSLPKAQTQTQTQTEAPYKLEAMTIEHINISLYMDVPMLFAITKVDLLSPPAPTPARGVAPAAPSAVSKEHPRVIEIVSSISTFFSEATAQSNRYRFRCLVVESPSQLVEALMWITDRRRTDNQQSSPSSSPSLDSSNRNGDDRVERVVPIFLVSAVTGFGLDLLKSCLFQLPSCSQQTSASALRTQLTADPGSDGSSRELCVRLLGTIARVDDSSGEEGGGSPEAEEPKPRSRPPSSRPSPKHCSSWQPPKSKGKNKSTSKEGSPELPPRAPMTSPISGLDLSFLALESSPNSRSSLMGLFPLNTGEADKDRDRDSELYQKKILIAFVQKGQLQCGQTLLIGPMSQSGRFDSVRVASIRLNNVPIRFAVAGQTVTLTLTSGLEVPRAPMESESEGDPCSTSETSLSKRSSVDGLNESALRGVAFLDKGTSNGAKGSAPLSSPLSTSSLDALNPAGSGGGRRLSVKGLVLLSAEAGLSASAHYLFEAELRILSTGERRTVINVNYEPVVHVGGVNQSAKLISFVKISRSEDLSSSDEAAEDGLRSRSSDKEDQGGFGGTPITTSSKEKSRRGSFEKETEALIDGDRAICRFKFLYFPEYLEVGSAMIIREHRTKGVGTITRLL